MATVGVLWVCYMHPFFVSIHFGGWLKGGLYIHISVGFWLLFVFRGKACEGLDKMNGQRVQIPALFFVYATQVLFKSTGFRESPVV